MIYININSYKSRSYLSVHMFQMQNQWMDSDIHENWNGSTSHTSNENLRKSLMRFRPKKLSHTCSAQE
jgi:hypothetical protein